MGMKTKMRLPRLYLLSMVLLGTLFSGSARADLLGNFLETRDFSSLYYGLNFSDGSADVNGGSDESLGVLSGVLGLRLIDFLGVEVQVGSGSDDTQSLLSDSEVTFAAAMVRAGIQIHDVGIYGLVGQTFLDTSSRINFSRSGNALGLGLNLFGSKKLAVNFQYLRLGDGALSNASVGFQYYFGGYR